MRTKFPQQMATLFLLGLVGIGIMAEITYSLSAGRYRKSLYSRAKHLFRWSAAPVGATRIYEAPIDQWAIENNKLNSRTFEFSNASAYMKSSVEHGRTSGSDILNNTYFVPSAANSPGNSADVTRKDFWESYAP